MAKKSKAHREMASKIEKREYAPIEAFDLLKEIATAKFDESVEAHFRLGIDTRKADQQLRGTVSLPNGSGKTVRVCVFAGGDAAEAARAAGADYVGMADLIEKITKEGWCDFDVAIATVEAMKEVRKCARILGPRGLMPNPKTGTVTDDTATAVKEAKGGKVDFRMDKTGNLSVIAGKRSFTEEALVGNIAAIVAAVNAAKPANVKGVFLKSMSISSTMGVSCPVALASVAE